MPEFFRGWRRKMESIALMLACTVFSPWKRSRVLMDFYEFSARDRQPCFDSYHGYLSWRPVEGSSSGRGNDF